MFVQQLVTIVILLIENCRECDDQKNEAIGKACEQVNVDFGQIFSTLLAGNLRIHVKYILYLSLKRNCNLPNCHFSPPCPLLGTNSKLVPIYKNNNTLEGLEIKVTNREVSPVFLIRPLQCLLTVPLNHGSTNFAHRWRSATFGRKA